MFQHLRLVLAAVVANTMASCVVGPDYDRPELETGAEFENAPDPAPIPPPGDWWKEFKDPGLNRLIRDLENDNPTLDIALARYDEARAALGLAEADRSPALFGDAFYRRERATKSGTFVPDPATNSKFEAALNLEYEVDLWGRVRRSVEAARGDLAAAGADVAAAQLSLKAEMARTWFQFVYLDREIALVRRAIEVRAENRDLIEARVRGGESTDLDLAQAKTEYESTRAQLLELQQLREQRLHALAALAGKPPSEFTAPGTENTRPPPSIPTGVPSELLARRPDVAAQEQRLAAAIARIGVVKADLLPRLTITGRGGLSSLQASDFLQPTSLFGDIGPDLSVPIWQGGRILSEKAGAEAAARRELAAYREIVLTAIKETEDALSGIRWLDREIDAHEKAAEAAADATGLSRRRYAGGLVSYLEVVDSERTRLSESRALTQSRSARQNATVLLIQALGGGWEAP